MRHKLLSLVKIVWHDISSVNDGDAVWLSRKTILENAKKAWKDEYISVGYLIEYNKDYTVIAATKDGDDFADVSIIPSSVIIRIKALR